MDPEKTFVQYERVRLRVNKIKNNRSIRWQCILCSVTFTTMNDEVIRGPAKQHKSNKCESLIPDQLECISEYEKLKYLAKQSDDFTFADEYKKSLVRLHTKFENKSIADFWPELSKDWNFFYVDFFQLDNFPLENFNNNNSLLN